ncbi:alpha-ketoglutarate dehydrogenase component 4 isoform 1-T1 [Hipposideros larvatus]
MSKINPTSQTFLCKTNNGTHTGQFRGGKSGGAGRQRGVELPPQWRRIPPACPSFVTSHRGPSPAAYYSCNRCGSRAPRKLPLLGGHDGQQDGVCQQGRSVSEVLRSAGLPSHSISQHSKGSKSPDWLMHQGPPDTAEIIKTLPQKYRRKLVSQEEMEFIQRGGPE